MPSSGYRLNHGHTWEFISIFNRLKKGGRLYLNFLNVSHNFLLCKPISMNLFLNEREAFFELYPIIRIYLANFWAAYVVYSISSN